MDTYRLFTTRDGGNQWTELPSPPHDGQLDFNNVITVGSYDSDEVFIGQIAFWRSLDGGRKGGANDYKTNPPMTDTRGRCWAAACPFPIPTAGAWICTATSTTSCSLRMAAFFPILRRSRSSMW